MAALFASYGVLISLSILGLVCVAILALLIAVASKSRPKSDDPAEAAADISIAAVKASFLRAVQQIESSLVSRSERHEIPWVMVLDEPDNSFDMPLEEAGCSSLISEEAAKSLNTPGLQWHVLEQGVVVEVNTISKGSESEGVLATFLSLVQKYRPDRPLDSIVVSIPCSLLESDQSADIEALKERAQRYHRLIKSCESALGMRLAIYVTITGIENWAGATEIIEDFPPALRDGMLGWSNPNDLGTQFQISDLGPAIQNIASAFLSILIEQSVDSGIDTNYLSKLVVGKRIKRLTPNLSHFLQEVLRPNANDEAFFFRGFYFVLGCESHARGEMGPCGFMRDLFEQKIFMERGITRSNRVLIERQKSHRRQALVVAASVVTVYGVVVAFELFTHAMSMNRWKTQVESLGQTIDARTPAALRVEIEELRSLIDETERHKFWAFSIPSSWPFWNDTSVDTSRASFERYLVALTLLSVKEFDSRLASLGGVSSQGEINVSRIRPCSLENDVAGTQRELLAYSDELLLMLFEMRERLSELQRLLSDEQASIAFGQTLGLIKRSNLNPPEFDLKSVASPQVLNPFVDTEMLESRGQLLDRIASCAVDNIVATTGRLLTKRQPLFESEVDVQGKKEVLINQLRSRTVSKETLSNAYDALIGALNRQNRMISEFNQTGEDLRVFADAVEARIAEFAKNRFVTDEKQDEALASIDDWVAGFVSSNPIDADNALNAFVRFDETGQLAQTPERQQLLADLSKIRLDPINAQLSSDDEFLGFAGLVRLDAKRLSNLVSRLQDETNAESTYTSVDDAINDALILRKTRFSVARFMADVRLAQVPVGKLNEEDYARFSEGANLLSQASTYLFDLEFYDAASTIDFYLAQIAVEYLGYLDESFERIAPFAALQQSVMGGASSLLDSRNLQQDVLRLTNYIDKQVSVVRRLNEQASFIRPYLRSAYATRWTAIDSGLMAFDSADPRSGLGLLYAMIDSLSQMSSGECERLKRGIAVDAEADSFFGPLATNFADGVLRACVVGQQAIYETAWSDFRDFYASRLRGRAPFGFSEFGGAVTLSSLTEAQLLFDTFKTSLGDRFEQVSTDPFIAQWLDFQKTVEQMRITDDEFGVKVNIEFRTDREREEFANQLIEYELLAPSGALGEANDPVLWRIGDPITVRLRLASNSAFEFVNADGSPTVEPKELTLEYRGDWALYSVIRNGSSGAVVRSSQSNASASVPMMFEFFLQTPGTSGSAPLQGALSATVRFLNHSDAMPIQFPVNDFPTPPAFFELPGMGQSSLVSMTPGGGYRDER